mmetsp:Transcript_87846/g.273032  ORF Transcript_87846/g.273032 Transcript_87846/m.273032 type:complete len:339 (+) Transcript_87846:248-1264(+)
MHARTHAHANRHPPSPRLAGDEGAALEIRPEADVIKLVVHEELAVAEDLHEDVLGGITLALRDCDEVAILVDVAGAARHAGVLRGLVEVLLCVGRVRNLLERQTALLAGLAGVGDGVLEHEPGGPVHRDLRALEGALEGVAVQALEQGAARAKGHVLRRDLVVREGLQDLGDGLVVHAIALDEADVGREQLVARRRRRVAEALDEDLQALEDRVFGLTAVGPDHEASGGRRALLDELLQLLAPVLAAGVPDVEGVRDAGHQAVRVLREHVAHGIQLVLLAPRGDGGVLRGRDGEGGALEEGTGASPVELLGAMHCRDGVCTDEVHEVAATARHGRLHR